MNIKVFLNQIVKNPELHGRWLNSLSYLEYRGVRKIMRSQHTKDINEELLAHAMEEARHALVFKKMALKIGGPEFSTYSDNTLLAPNAIKSYFYELDKKGSEYCCHQNSEFTPNDFYKWITWTIEERALQVYQIYDQVLKENGIDLSLNSILSDEFRHLNEVRKENQRLPNRGRELQRIENHFFDQLYSSLNAEVRL
jgi:hypothetical protein